MNTINRLFATLSLLLLAASSSLRAQVPQIINYQGKVAVADLPFTGAGQFRFALVNGTGSTTYWSNDGTSTAGSQPTAAVALTVTNGIYSVGLGDTALANMVAVPATVFDNGDVRVRVWFNDGTHGSELLTPDQRITATGYAMKAASLSAVATPSAPAPGNAGTMYFNTTDNRLYYSDGTNWLPVGAPPQTNYRWAVWSTYEQGTGWFFGNDGSLMAGVNPSNWSDSNYLASQISADKKVQATLFNKKAAVSPNSVVWAETYLAYSSTDGRFSGALFRVRNKTGAAINWTLNFHATAYGGWGENASVALNGANSWSSAGVTLSSSAVTSVTLAIPANRVSTVICVAGSGVPTSTGGTVYSRSTALAFRANCLTLPAGLEFVDDLDTATGGFEQ